MVIAVPHFLPSAYLARWRCHTEDYYSDDEAAE